MTTDLALFPLHTVLFPRAPLRIRVFEPRYRTMIDDCVREERPFGVALIRKGVEAMGPLPEPHTIGCEAHIERILALPEGDLMVEAVGHRRFAIEALVPGTPYLTIRARHLRLAGTEAASVDALGRDLRRWVTRYISAISGAARPDIAREIDTASLPKAPSALAYVAASLLPIPPSAKQTLLAQQDAGRLLADVCDIYRRELPLLESMLERGDLAPQGPFSRN